MKPDRRLIALLVALAVTVLPQQRAASAATPRTTTGHHIVPLHVASVPLSPAAFTVPASNVAFASPVLDEHHVVYAVAWPRMYTLPHKHDPTCATCGGAQSTAFHMQIYIRLFQSGSGGIVVSQPRLLFTGPRGAQVAFMAFHHGWLIYETYLVGDRWALFARNVVSGRQILLDSPRQEGMPSRFVQAGSDGSTVVWQGWRRMGGTVVSAIRSYSLLTGQRRLLLSGGTGQDFFYGSPAVSGDRLVYERGVPDGTAQLFLEIMATGRTRALTPLHQLNGEAAIAGNVVVWVHGSLAIGHNTHGLVVLNLANGHRLALTHSPAQLPRIAAGRYVVFGTVDTHTSVQSYDTRTHQRRTLTAGRPLVGPGSSDGQVEAGGHVVLYSLLTVCGGVSFPCPERFVLVALP